MRWCVASFADADTYLAEPGAPGQTVTARCDGRQFCPLAILPGAAPDPEQVCSACRAGQPSLATPTRRIKPEKVPSLVVSSPTLGLWVYRLRSRGKFCLPGPEPSHPGQQDT